MQKHCNYLSVDCHPSKRYFKFRERRQRKERCTKMIIKVSIFWNGTSFSDSRHILVIWGVYQSSPSCLLRPTSSAAVSRVGGAQRRKAEGWVALTNMTSAVFTWPPILRSGASTATWPDCQGQSGAQSTLPGLATLQYSAAAARPAKVKA